MTDRKQHSHSTRPGRSYTAHQPPITHAYLAALLSMHCTSKQDNCSDKRCDDRASSLPAGQSCCHAHAKRSVLRRVHNSKGRAVAFAGWAGASPRSKREPQQGTPIQLASSMTIADVQSASSIQETMFLPAVAPSRCRGFPEVQARIATRNTPARGFLQHGHSHANKHEWPQGPVHCARATRRLEINPRPSMLDTTIRHERPKFSACPTQSSQLVFASAVETGGGVLRCANHVLGC
jgi:hypothetical protein